MKTVFIIIGCLLASVSALAQDGMESIQSPYNVSTTIDKLASILDEKGMSVFGRVDHAANAEKAGLSLRPTELLIFGNPKIGTPLMNCAQSVALDLPQKMLAWEDADGQTYLTWNDPMHLKSRHGIEGCDEIIDRVSGALSSFARAATSE
ncbi:MAG: DUF302 domain-containing protein [Granulosicoccus sp.]